MLRVRVSELLPSMRLARPIHQPTDPSRVLLQRDMLVDDRAKRHLTRLGIAEVWVRCEDLAFLEDLVDIELQERQRELYTSIRENFERVYHRANVALDFDAFSRGVGDLFGYLRQNTTGLVFVDKLQTFDNYLMVHAANVAYLSLLVGMKLGPYLEGERPHLAPAAAREVVALGLGGLLHDVGKLRIPKKILNKPGRLTPEEMDEIKAHPVLGFEMVRGRVPSPAAQVVLDHHQRWDGTGYPEAEHRPFANPRPEGKRIHVFPRIATICDVFDAATSKRIYSDAKPAIQVLSEMLRFNRGFFDPVIQRTFFEVVPPFPLGTLVTLSSGISAAVVDFHPGDPCRPNVQPLYYPDGARCVYPDNAEIALSELPAEELSICHVGHIDVRPFHFSRADVLGAEPAAA